MTLTDKPEVDLRVGDNVLDINSLIHDRKYFDQTIRSEVEYQARLRSVTFPELHHRLLRPYLERAYIADSGCGQLPYLHAFSNTEVKGYFGFDLGENDLRLADRYFSGAFPLHLVESSVYDLPLSECSMDAAISSEVLEHVDDPDRYLQELRRILKVNGMLSLSTPCASMYLYPHNWKAWIRNPAGLRRLYHLLTPEQRWQEALTWHPGLRPRVLRNWMRKNGFKVIRHRTTLWYYGTPLKLSWRFAGWLEQLGLHWAGPAYAKYLGALEKVLASNVPILKWAGIRQFVLCRKL